MADDALLVTEGEVAGVAAAEMLAEVEEQFQQGVTCIRANKLDEAVEIFSKVLQARVEHFGMIAPECASAYYRYGSALLYQAQESADVFGGPMSGGGDADKENGLDEAQEEEEGGEKQQQPVSEAGGSGAATATNEETEAAGPSNANTDDKDDGPVEGDMQLAWENLETARAIWARQSSTENAEMLASVHMLLGDVNMENEAFENALADYDAALEHQTVAGFPSDDRRIAELQFKRVFALQFLDRIEDALVAVNAAVDVLQRRRAALLQEGGVENVKTAADVDAVLEEVKDKVQELETVLEETAATKMALKGAMTQITAAMAAKNTNTNTNGASGSGAGASGAVPGASPVKDLGVVGRGTKRINLAPMAVETGGGGGGGGASEQAPQQSKKRSLSELMDASGGGGGGETVIGFGGGGGTTAVVGTTNAATTTEGDVGTVPAFLQAYKKPE